MGRVHSSAYRRVRDHFPDCAGEARLVVAADESEGRTQVAAMFLGHHRASLAQHGASLPADAHAPWRGAQRIAAEQLGAAAFQAGLQRGERLSADAADRLLFDEDFAS